MAAFAPQSSKISTADREAFWYRQAQIVGPKLFEEVMHTILAATLALAVAPDAGETTAIAGREAPEARAHHQVVYHGGKERVYLIGGRTPRGEGHHFFDDIWSWDGKRWQHAGSLPFPRSSHRAVHHRGRNTIVLFGGGSGRPMAIDHVVWEWNDTGWRAVGESHLGGLAEPGMCYDQERSRVVLFGGWDEANRFNGVTWEWDGERMLEIDVGGPSARAGHAFVYDPVRRRCVVFGGRDEDGVLSDTWDWDGAAWRRIETLGPSARWVMGSATDEAHRRVVLFGGWSADETFLGDTWAWNGESWELVTDEGPPPRIGGQMAFAGDGVLLFGGRSRADEGFRDHGDTWVLQGKSWRPSGSGEADSAAHEFLDRLVGSWTLTGTMGAIELRQRVTARWVVGEQFLQMQFVQEGPSDPGKPPYEALYLLGYDERSDQLVLHLFDTFGTSFSRTLGIGTRRGDAVELLFDYPSGLFSNTFAWDAKTDRWTMTLRQREADGGWRLFAVKTLTRP